MPNYRRSYVPGGTWFFTINLFDRYSDLLTRHLTELRWAIQKVKLRYPFEIDAWVILPDHMHCIWTLPAGDSNYSARWREIKKSFTKSLTYATRPVWQKRFWEHCIREEQDYAARMNYVYINPLKHGLVDKVSDWPFSSFHRDVKRGLYPADWAGESGDLNTGERR
ncbi:transposase [Enterobacteriaceae bacterium H20N1]|uniref:Transposase n=1 Tax=Dryocola boscaweniae TaxID=2925397 RepID=A0A9X2W9Y9_9ENTR|nr:transposase [Dryocola boscaweniae]MCT4702957.1 transposase [Dryocola boscaweniae]MCT4720125.1 transposase [Dryocola boscaweniae]